ncbi:hypothetical protein CPLU01_13135 [Colletotrichum plurivorum]|uniref:DUF6604 domain-containing protein n=1 Tax=Colletotrichum plurivorum TaxID=2175906 RepID=A0A8H6JTN6_9PEZI|nr:hypothetical protein CPLU01_13135 [Colletotrichum plurivorum]
MATHNSYLAYKRDTRNLVYWMIHASNAVIKSLPATEDESSTTLALNTSGQTNVAGLVAMAELIGKHIKPVPNAIFQLLRSVIVARSAHHAEFQQFAAAKPDADVEKSNVTHKFFIDALARAFKALGGDDWVSDQKKPSQLDASEIDEVVFSNQSAALKLGADDRHDSSGESSDDEASAPGAPQRRAQRKPGKGKKGKKGKKPKSKKKQKTSAAQQDELDGLPVESYRIIESEDGLVTEYLMAVYSITREWTDLRDYLQDVWHDVAYKGLNGAVAGTLSNLAIAMIKQTESDIFVDFPGHESYETVLKTITRGNIDKAQGMFTVSLVAHASDEAPRTVKESNVDIKEHFLANAYTDLFDFVTDYQKNRTGKPTKAMQAEINNWDPNFNPQRATREQRLKWRRSYTLNWLYDLVNVFSGVVVQRIRVKGENHVLEDVDWSPGGPWGMHRSVYGINEFAAVVTTLAMQKPGTDVRKRILPHHVFQLQLIVDAFTISRGWSFSVLRGHVLKAPPKNFRPRRDVDNFMDRDTKRNLTGFLQSVYILRQCLDKFGANDGSSGRFRKPALDILEELNLDFRDWLGESKYMYGLNKIPPSRFFNTNANGLWEYSPFLCGVGLMEALELAYRGTMILWETLPEPTLVIHLHNMLVQKGYLAQPVGLFASLQDLLPEAFFASGKPPTSNFHLALADRMVKATTVQRGSKLLSKPSAHQVQDIHALLDLSINRNFRTKSNLMLYREAGWNVDRIPDSAIEPISLLGTMRLSQTKHAVDPVTGVRRFEDTELVRRFRERGVDEDELIRMTGMAVSAMQKFKEEIEQAQSFIQRVVPDYKFFSDAEIGAQAVGGGSGIRVLGRDLLKAVRPDIVGDVCGDRRPLSALNYVSVLNWLFFLFGQFEDELKRRGHPLYEIVFGSGGTTVEKNVRLVTLAVGEQDEEVLRILAGEFQKHRTGFINYIYWDDLSSGLESPTSGPESPAFGPGCSIM